MRRLLEDEELRRRVRCVLVLDGAGVEHITAHGVGSRRFLVTVSGPGGHSWNDFGLANPIYALSAAVTSFAASPVAAEPRTTLNVGQIQGGTSINSIPSAAWIKVDIRSSSAAEIRRLSSLLEKAVRLAVEQENQRARAGRVACQIEEIGERPAADLPEHARILETVRAVDRYLGIRSRIERSSTDANIPLSMGIEAVSLGGGGTGGAAHSLNEWYDPASRELGLKRLCWPFPPSPPSDFLGARASGGLALGRIQLNLVPTGRSYQRNLAPGAIAPAAHIVYFECRLSLTTGPCQVFLLSPRFRPDTVSRANRPLEESVRKHLVSLLRWMANRLQAASPPRPTPPQPISRDELRTALAEMLADPVTHKQLLRSLAGTVFPIAGGVCDVLASQVSPGIFGTDGSCPTPRAFTFESNAAATIPLTVKGVSGQTANLMEWKNSAGTVLAVVANDGSLGVGTTTPQRLLHLSRTDTFIAGIRLTSNNSGWYLDHRGANEAPVNRLAIFNNTPTEVFTILQSGNVGIGTNNPGRILHLARVTTGVLGIKLTNNAKDWYLDHRGANDPSPQVADRLAIFNNTPIEVVTVLQSGNVGINTTNPAAKLHIGGDVRIGSEDASNPGGVQETLLFGATTHKQVSFGPEMITAAATTPTSPAGSQRRVVIWAGRTGDSEAQFLLNSTGFLEWGAGGTFPFQDQDCGLRREPRASVLMEPAVIGDMLLLSNGGFQVGRADQSGRPSPPANSNNLRLDVNAGPMSKGLLSSTGNVSPDETVTIGPITYQFKTTLATPNDDPYAVKIGTTAAESLSNLKAAIDDVDSTPNNPGTRYGKGTAPNPVATVPPAYRNDNTGDKFRVDGMIPGVDVAASEVAQNLQWEGLTAGKLTPITYMVGINVPPGQSATGSLEVRHIGSGFPTFRLNQKETWAPVLEICKESGGQPCESHPRFRINGDGTLNWGPGNAAQDVAISRVSAGALALGAPNAAPPDANLNNSNISFWVDEINNKLKAKVKRSDGTVKTVTISFDP